MTVMFIPASVVGRCTSWETFNACHVHMLSSPWPPSPACNPSGGRQGPTGDMCLLTFAVDAHASIPFVAIHNRDESTQRPTTDLQCRDHVVAAFDESLGGTWMVSRLCRGTRAA